MDHWTIFITLLAGVIALCYHLLKTITFFKERDIPHMKPLPFLGNMGPVVFRRISMAEQIQKIYNYCSEAKFVGFFDFTTPVVVIRDLDLFKSMVVKNVEHFLNRRAFVDGTVDPFFAKNLLSLQGDKWREVRSVLSPAFTSSKMKGMFKLMTDCGKSYGKCMASMPPDKREVNVRDLVGRYTTDVIATCAFGISVNSMENPNNEFYKHGKSTVLFDGLPILKFFFLRGFPTVSKLLNLRLVPKRLAKFFEDVVATTVRTRKEQNIIRPDMIELMMETNGKVELSAMEMASQAFVFFLGGFDTSANAMSFVAHELALNPDVQEKLQSEIDRVLEDSNGEPTYDAINGMQYLDAVVNEIQRMYPIATFLDRLCTKEFELPPPLPGGKPVTLKEGTVIWFPVYGVHHDPQYFEEPEKFKPERFVEKGKEIINSGAYLPFGLGPRMCIGNRFALLEIKVLIFYMLAWCDLKPCSKTPMPLKLDRSGFTLRAAGGFWLKVQPRSNPHPTLRNLSNGTTKVS